MSFAHGFGGDQNMSRFVWPAFADQHRVILFDHVGAGGSDASAFDPGRGGGAGALLPLVLVCSSPRDVDDGDYIGGFTGEDIEGLLDSMDSHGPGAPDDICLLAVRLRSERQPPR